MDEVKALGEEVAELKRLLVGLSVSNNGGGAPGGGGARGGEFGGEGGDSSVISSEAGTIDLGTVDLAGSC